MLACRHWLFGLTAFAADHVTVQQPRQPACLSHALDLGADRFGIELNKVVVRRQCRHAQVALRDLLADRSRPGFGVGLALRPDVRQLQLNVATAVLRGKVEELIKVEIRKVVVNYAEVGHG